MSSLPATSRPHTRLGPRLGHGLGAARASDRVRGVGFGAGAGALWGLVFLAPALAAGFSALELSVARYLAYGAVAAVLIAPRWRIVTAHLPRGAWGELAWLACAGNLVHVILLFTAIRLGGIAMTSLVIGFLPVAVTLIGARDHGAVPLRRLWPSLAFSAAGAVCIGWDALAGPASSTAALGLLCALGGLATWTAFAVGNARALARLPQVGAQDWNLLIGVVCGALSLLLVPVVLLLPGEAGAGLGAHEALDWARFAAVAVGLALIASIAGNALWNRMSRLLPLTLAGQMILFRTLFALLYGWLWEQRWPTLLEGASLVLVVLGVVTCVAAHRPRS